jgi:hypothetical protein
MKKIAIFFWQEKMMMELAINLLTRHILGSCPYHEPSSYESSVNLQY